MEASEAQTAEAKQAAAEELASRLSVHKRELTALETAASAAEHGGRLRPEYSSVLALVLFCRSPLIEPGTWRKRCFLRCVLASFVELRPILQIMNFEVGLSRGKKLTRW